MPAATVDFGAPADFGPLIRPEDTGTMRDLIQFADCAAKLGRECRSYVVTAGEHVDTTALVDPEAAAAEDSTIDKRFMHNEWKKGFALDDWDFAAHSIPPGTSKASAKTAATLSPQARRKLGSDITRRGPHW